MLLLSSIWECKMNNYFAVWKSRYIHTFFDWKLFNSYHSCSRFRLANAWMTFGSIRILCISDSQFLRKRIRMHWNIEMLKYNILSKSLPLCDFSLANSSSSYETTEKGEKFNDKNSIFIKSNLCVFIYSSFAEAHTMNPWSNEFKIHEKIA